MKVTTRCAETSTFMPSSRSQVQDNDQSREQIESVCSSPTIMSPCLKVSLP
jgi:hypothetical protein